MRDVDTWRRVEALLDSAFNRQPGADRDAFLDAACGDDAALRAEIDSLLRHQAGAAQFIEAPAYVLGASLLAGLPDDGDARAIGARIGPYQITSEIGRGGMGTVYLAARADEAYEKRVAIKVVRRGLDTEDVLRRFRYERQILASLDHPNIARLLDGGSTDDGLPYLVMEYVDGQPITKYVEAHALPTRDRLTLFLTVCAAVEYAHRHLVIHRDLKPSNILVTADGVPKLLDFGIARLLDPDRPDERTLTRTPAYTPRYASPEQMRGGGGITTATDVYSLGLVLKEVLEPLTGRNLAFRDKFPGGQVNLGDGSEGPEARERGASGPRHDPELQTIVAMACREEPERRYASVAQLAADLQRHLDGRPVIARKDTMRYRATKFINRNRFGVAAAAVVMIATMAGVAGTVWQAQRAAEQARIAAAERDRARVEALKARRVNVVLQNILGFGDTVGLVLQPQAQRAPDDAIAAALEQAGRRAEAQLGDEPEVLAALQFIIGRTHLARSRIDAAEPYLKSALATRQRLLGADHPETAEVLGALGGLANSRGKYEEAESLLSRAVGIYRGARASGTGSLEWFHSMLVSLALVQFNRGHAADAEATYKEALEVSEQLTGPARAARAHTLAALAVARRGQGDLDGAIAYQEQAVEEFRRLPGPRLTPQGVATANFGFFMMMKGDYPRAEALYREALDIYRDTVGDQSPLVAYPHINLAENHYLQRDYGRAREEVDRALQIQKQLLAEGHVDYGLSYTILGRLLTTTGDIKQGEAYLRRGVEVRTRALGKGHRLTAESESALGECLVVQKRYAEAEPLLTASYETLKARVGDRDRRTREARARLDALQAATTRTASTKD